MPKLLIRPTVALPPPQVPAAVVQAVAQVDDVPAGPLWLGPDGEGPLGGISQSMLSDYCSCRERFRIKYILGLQPGDRWRKEFGYGNMWHLAEEHHGAGNDWRAPLEVYATQQMAKYPFDRQDVQKWVNVCLVQFPEYVKYWANNPQVLERKSLMQEQVIDVPYDLPSGRRVRIRGKVDGACLLPTEGGAFMDEHKTKGDVDPVEVQRRLKFDIQTMTYQTALETWATNDPACPLRGHPILGVRYNVVRRPLSGGKGSITPHQAKTTKEKVYKTKPNVPGVHTPAETDAEFYERLRRDYIAAEPEYWFCRFTSRVSATDVAAFRRQCLDPLLENATDDCQWWTWCLKRGHDHWDYRMRETVFPTHVQRHFRFPFGCWNPLTEQGHTEYDAMLETGNEAGLRRATSLFPELQEGA